MRKSKLIPSIKLKLRLTLMSFSLFLLQPTFAQVINPAINTDNFLGTRSNANTINCDMMEDYNGSGNTLSAIVWDNFPSSTPSSHMYVTYSGGGTANVTLPSDALYPDVAIGYYHGDPASCDYLITVVYVEHHNPGTDFAKLAQYCVTNVGTVSFAVNFIGTTTLSTLDPISNPGNIGAEPHIDLFADIAQTTGSSNLPTYHDFIATWVEFPNATSVPELYTAYGSILNPSAATITNTTLYCAYQDVAAVTDNSSGTHTAYMVYNNGLFGTTEWFEFDPSTSSITSTATLYNNVGLSRIEAMSVYTPGNAKWNVAMRDATLFTNVIYSYNDLNMGGFDCSSSLFSGNNNHAPVVAAGIGGTGPSGNIGNSQYTVAWYSQGAEIYSVGVASSTGNLINPDFYQVNNGAISTFGFPAMSSSTNTGLGLLAAWTDPSNIYYKIIGNTYQFKTAGVETIPKTGIEIHPNPVQDYINIKGVLPRQEYVIMDITGRMILSGLTNNDNTINVQNLSKGMYTLNLQNNDANERMRFIKD